MQRILLITLVIFLLISSSSIANHSIKVGVYNFQPLIFIDDEKGAGGLYIDVLDHIAEKENWQIEYVPCSWNECLTRLKAGTINLLPSIAYSKERAGFLDFTNEFLFLDWGLVYVKKGSEIHDLFDLEGKTISVLKGSIYTKGFKDLLDQFGINAVLKEKNEYTQVFEAVDTNEVDAGINAQVHGMRLEGNYDIERTDIFFSPVKIRFAVKKGQSAILLNKLDEYFSSMKADRQSIYYSLFNKWMGIYEKKPLMPQWLLWSLGVIAGLFVIAFAFSLSLKKQVKVKTSALKSVNYEFRESEKKHRRLVDNLVGSYVYRHDVEGKFTYVSRSITDVLGYSVEEFLTHFAEYLIAHPVNRKVIRHTGLSIQGIQQPPYEVQSYHKDGTVHWLEVSEIPVLDTDGSVIAVEGIAHDITERKKAANELMEKENQLNNLLSNIEAIVLEGDPFYIYYVGGQVEKLLGYPREKWFEDPDGPVGFWAGLLHPDDKDIAAICRASIEKGENHSLEYRLKTSDGNYRWFCDYLTVETEKGVPVKTRAVMMDITELKRTEKDLKQQAAFVSNNPAPVMQVNLIGNIIFCNPALKNLFSYDPTGTSIYNFFPKFKDTDLNNISMESPVQFEDDIGEKSFLFTAKRDPATSSYYMYGFDITERKALENQLVQSQKMESIGTLAGGIAHDFNNILNAIMGFTYLAKLKTPEGSEAVSDLDRVTNATNRATDLVRQILTFSRRGVEELQPLIVTPIVKEAMKLLRASIPSTIEIRDNITPTDSIMADPTQVHQVLMNLCTNAYHAMQETGGVMEVDLQDVNVDSDLASRYADMNPGPHVRLTVSDTGKGIDSSIIDRIYEPYFTTKEQEKGSGLGLAVVHGIVKSFGGTIMVESEVGSGTTLQVFFPAAGEAGWLLEKKDEELVSGKGSVLFVDDEEFLVEIGKEILESLGYETVVSVNSQEALEIFKRNPGRIDVVITDMTMPKMTGMKLAKEIRQIRPDLPIILTTGYSEGISEETVKDAGISALMMKPFTPEKLSQTIRRVLEKETYM